MTGDLFGEPKKPEHMVLRGQPATSLAAARRVSRSLSSTMLKVLEVLHDFGPMTDRELDIQCRTQFGERPESSYRKRRSDLAEEKRGLVIACGTKLEAGSDRALWKLTEKGQAVWAALHAGISGDE